MDWRSLADLTRHLRLRAVSLATSSPATHMSTWTEVSPETMPESGVYVLAFYVDEHERGRVVRATWWTGEMLDDWDEDWDGEGPKNKDGWFEVADHTGETWRITERVTHWTNLPGPPA